MVQWDNVVSVLSYLNQNKLLINVFCMKCFKRFIQNGIICYGQLVITNGNRLLINKLYQNKPVNIIYL